MGKLIIVANRLPVSIRVDSGDVECKPSTGGLATGLAGLSGSDGVVWVGWDGLGEAVSSDERQLVAEELMSRGLRGVAIEPALFHGYYNDFANGALWPLYHYQPERMPLTLVGWDAYQTVNRIFAEEVASIYGEGDTVWVHDYHLQLVPQLLRERIPDARIGFFMHIPFPSSEVFRILPWRRQILEGLLGADVIGFHTHAFARHFRSALLRILGIDAYADSVFDDGRTIKISAFPLGVDVTHVARPRPYQDGELAASLQLMKADGRVKHVMLSIDRLDYTKGLPRRILAVESLLENAPELRGSVALVQVAAPSRDDVPAYEAYRRDVEGLVGRVNGRFGMPGYQPIHYVSRAFSHEEILAAYPHVDVMVVTPLRDGMNLVAKEFVASRSDLDGALVLSEFAGAADELGEAVQVNPYDIADVAAGMQAAIQMSPEERRERMKALRARVTQFDASTWAKKFTEFLRSEPQKQEHFPYLKPRELAARIPSGQRKILFLDYDGTLFPIVRIPQLATPDTPLLMLLARLTAHPDFEVHLVSGRSPTTLETWFGKLPLHLHAEHGALSRAMGSDTWTPATLPAITSDWKAFVRPVLEDLVRNTPGSFVEEKTHSIAWHYRMSDPIHAERMANELRLHGRETFSPLGLELLPGKRLVEIRAVGLNKGQVVSRILAAAPDDAFAVAIGDDVTDEDMFEAMPATGMTIFVGDQPSKAQWRLRDPSEVRRLLEQLVFPGEGKA